MLILFICILDAFNWFNCTLGAKIFQQNLVQDSSVEVAQATAAGAKNLGLLYNATFLLFATLVVSSLSCTLEASGIFSADKRILKVANKT